MVTFQHVPAAIPSAIAAAVSAILVAIAIRRRKSPLAAPFVAMMAGETLWALSSALEPAIAEIAIKRICIDVRILGTLVALLGLVAFVVRHAGWNLHQTIRAIAALGLPAVAVLVIACTDPLHHLYFRELVNERIGDAWYARRTFGPALWANVVYSYTLAAVAVAILVNSVARSDGNHRVQALVMLSGVLIPWTAEILDRASLLPFVPVDVVAPTFALTGLSLLPALFRYQLLDLPPVAWAAVVERMEDPVVLFDSRYQIVAANPAAGHLIEARCHPSVGAKPKLAFAHWGGLAEWLTAANGHERSTVLAGPDSAQTTIFDARISPLGDEGEPSGWVLVLRDITRRENAERERSRMLAERAARAEAEAASQAKDRFLAALSHELRTPLTPILATVTAMLDSLATHDVDYGALEMIRRNVALETRLIDDLLDMTRIRSGKLRLDPELIDAHEVIHHVVEICGDDMRASRIDLRLDLAARHHGLNADPTRMRQALWNIVKNAVKFTPAGGTVVIRTRDQTPDVSDPETSRLLIEIADTGIGIEPEAIPRIFEMFHQEDASAPRRSAGLGLGLMIARSIIERHGGNIHASSPGRNRGATFQITVPSIAPPEVHDDPTLPLPPHILIPDQALSILIVDDNIDTLRYLSEFLTRRGNRVYTAESVRSAHRIASEVSLDVIVSDIDLPDGSGLDLMATIHATQGTPGIALSGYGSSDDIALSRSAGFAEYLVKPVDFQVLEQAIHRVVESQRKDRPAPANR
jgi:signal transduction histidine kinase/CheY-like chemotaxis protein